MSPQVSVARSTSRPSDVLEMLVGSRQRQIGLQRDGSNPDVVLRDGSARLS